MYPAGLLPIQEEAITQRHQWEQSFKGSDSLWETWRNTEHATGLRLLSFVRSLKAARLKKDIELSKENFTSDNGKVD